LKAILIFLVTAAIRAKVAFGGYVEKLIAAQTSAYIFTRSKLVFPPAFHRATGRAFHIYNAERSNSNLLVSARHAYGYSRPPQLLPAELNNVAHIRIIRRLLAPPARYGWSRLSTSEYLTAVDEDGSYVVVIGPTCTLITFCD
jgi:hypothetical protein